MAEPLERLVEFGRALRTAGLPVGTGRIESFCRAAALVDAADLYWAGRATLVAGPDDIDVYDRVFRASFDDEPEPPPPPRARNVPAPDVTIGADVGVDDATEAAPAAASAIELLRQKSFARCSQDDLDQLAGLMARMRLEPPVRHARRRRPARGRVASTSDARFAGPSAPGASPSSEPAATGDAFRVESCSCSTSRARCRTTRAGS